MKPYDHPGDPEHVMKTYRRFILGQKRERVKATNGDRSQFRRGARSLVHYLDYVETYLAAKREMAERKRRACEFCAAGVPLVPLEPGTPELWHSVGGGTFHSCRKQLRIVGRTPMCAKHAGEAYKPPSGMSRISTREEFD